MAKSSNQKGKILYLERMLMETDEKTPVTMQDILGQLEERGISAERKSIYDDMETLRGFGMDVKYKRGRPGGYYLAAAEAMPDFGKIPDKKEIKEKETRITEKPETFAFQRTEGQGKPVKILCTYDVREKAEAFFGKAAEYKEKGDEGVLVTALVEENGQFYGWLVSMGKRVRLLKPKKSVQAYREYLKDIAKDYKA